MAALAAGTGVLFVVLVVVALAGGRAYNRHGRRSGGEMAEDMYGEGTAERMDDLVAFPPDAQGRPDEPGPHLRPTTYQRLGRPTPPAEGYAAAETGGRTAR